jgi:hypothetical protein
MQSVAKNLFSGCVLGEGIYKESATNIVHRKGMSCNASYINRIKLRKTLVFGNFEPQQKNNRFKDLIKSVAFQIGPIWAF